MTETKQVIVVRRDLNLEKHPGKLSAQVAHASVKSITDLMKHTIENEGSIHKITTTIGGVIDDWLLSGIFTKIVVGCKDEYELIELYNKANEEDLQVSIIKDLGRTVFKIPTYTCICIGPDISHKIDKITGHLQLLKG